MSFADVASCELIIQGMSDLQKAPGWLYFVASMEKAQSYAIDSLPGIQSEFERNKALGELVQIRKALAFPAKMIQQARVARERLKKKEK